MLNKILNIAKIAQISQQSSIKSYNATLPILLEVLNSSKNGYLLKLGNNTLEARSAQTLQIGAKYLAIIKETKSGEILISSLKQRSKIYELSQFYSKKIPLENLPNAYKNFADFYPNLLNSALECNNQHDFNFILNSILAYEKRVINLAIKDEKKEFLLQIKPSKKRIDFSAIFSNLGVILGQIYDKDLILKVQFEIVQKLLINNAYALSDFRDIKILLDSTIEPLFEVYGEKVIEA